MSRSAGEPLIWVDSETKDRVCGQETGFLWLFLIIL